MISFISWIETTKLGERVNNSAFWASKRDTICMVKDCEGMVAMKVKDLGEKEVTSMIFEKLKERSCVSMLNENEFRVGCSRSGKYSFTGKPRKLLEMPQECQRRGSEAISVINAGASET